MAGVIITGGTKGIGLSLVRQFASKGYHIATCARTEGDLRQLQQEIASAYPEAGLFVKVCNAADKKEIRAFGMEAVQALGQPDILINNAGIFMPGSIVLEEDRVFEEQIQTNLASAYHLSRVVLPGMMERKSGYIFNMCSIASIAAYPNGGSYTISKFGLLGLSKVLREELKPYRIRVSSILPGATLTPSWEGSGFPEQRFIQPDDLAQLIYHLAITPETMVVEEILVRPLEGDI